MISLLPGVWRPFRGHAPSVRHPYHPWVVHHVIRKNTFGSCYFGVAGMVLVPSFDHGVGDPIEDDIRVEQHHRIVLVEGNYLLLGTTCQTLPVGGARKHHIGLG